MKDNKLTPQLKWNNKHPECIRASYKRYYKRNRKTILRKLRIKYALKKEHKEASLQ